MRDDADRAAGPSSQCRQKRGELAWHNRVAVPVAVAVGAVIGVGCYLAGPFVAAVGGMAAGVVAFGAKLLAPVIQLLFGSNDATI